MRYGVIGGDMRLAHLVSLLNESGRETVGFLQEGAGGDAPLEALKSCGALILNWPVNQMLARRKIPPEEILSGIVPGSTLLFCGPKLPERCREDLKCVDLWADEQLLRENAWLTAEGAAAAVMRSSGRTLLGVKCAVVGCGRLGRALAEKLKTLGAEVTVVSRSAEKRKLAREWGVRSADLTRIRDVLREQRVIFSTPPAPVIEGETLRGLQTDALVIDLASPPYGVDLEAARELGIRAWREPGLPGRYCPLSAARAIFNALLRWEEGQKHG